MRTGGVGAVVPAGEVVVVLPVGEVVPLGEVVVEVLLPPGLAHGAVVVAIPVEPVVAVVDVLPVPPNLPLLEDVVVPVSLPRVDPLPTGVQGSVPTPVPLLVPVLPASPVSDDVPVPLEGCAPTLPAVPLCASVTVLGAVLDVELDVEGEDESVEPRPTAVGVPTSVGVPIEDEEDDELFPVVVELEVELPAAGVPMGFVPMPGEVPVCAKIHDAAAKTKMPKVAVRVRICPPELAGRRGTLALVDVFCWIQVRWDTATDGCSPMRVAAIRMQRRCQ